MGSSNSPGGTMQEEADPEPQLIQERKRRRNGKEKVTSVSEEATGLSENVTAAAGPSETSVQQTQKEPNTRSPWWVHFTRTSANWNKCVCNYCQRSLACPSKQGTSVLTNHLKRCKQFQAWKDGKSQPIVNKDGQLMEAKVSKEIFHEASEELIVLAELPLSFTENIGWKHFCRKVNLYAPQSRRTVTRNIVKMYGTKKEELKNLIVSNKYRLSLTTDIWKNENTGASYMVVTGHFIDTNWRLRKLILGFKYVGDHSGQTIATILLELLGEWGIDKVFCVTVDNATANTSAMKKFHDGFSLLHDDAFVLDGSYMHMRCSAHIINLVAKEGLDDVKKNVCAIRNAVTYLRGSTNRLKAFELKVDSGKLTRGSLPIDMKVRWNSTFLMLSRAVQYKLAFDKMEIEDKLYNDWFLEHENGSKRLGPPERYDWIAVEKLIQFLVIFYNSTLVVSASTRVNSHLCYGEIATIENSLIGKCNSYDPDLKLKAEDMLAKFNKYWNGFKNINKLLICASVFDPTKKMMYAKLCFETRFGKESTEATLLYEAVEDLLKDLFKEYSDKFGKGSPSPVQSSQSSHASSSTSSSQDPAVDRMELVYGDASYENMDFLYNEMIKQSGVEDTRNELDIYLKESVVVANLMQGQYYDVLSWWKVNSGKFPVLAEMAKDLLAMQVSSVASESAFSTSGRVLDEYRSCLTHFHIEVLICTEQWLKAQIQFNESTFMTNEKLLAEVEMLDSLQKKFEENRIDEED